MYEEYCMHNNTCSTGPTAKEPGTQLRRTGNAGNGTTSAGVPTVGSGFILGLEPAISHDIHHIYQRPRVPGSHPRTHCSFVRLREPSNFGDVHQSAPPRCLVPALPPPAAVAGSCDVHHRIIFPYFLPRSYSWAWPPPRLLLRHPFLLLDSRPVHAAWDQEIMLHVSSENAASCFILDLIDQNEFSAPSRPFAAAYWSHLRALTPMWYTSATPQYRSHWAGLLMAEVLISTTRRKPISFTHEEQLLLCGPDPPSPEQFLQSLEASEDRPNAQIVFEAMKPYTSLR